MQRCRQKHKLLPSSTYCKEFGIHVWTNVFRVEDDFEIQTGIRQSWHWTVCIMGIY